MRQGETFEMSCFTLNNYTSKCWNFLLSPNSLPKEISSFILCVLLGQKTNKKPVLCSSTPWTLTTSSGSASSLSWNPGLKSHWGGQKDVPFIKGTVNCSDEPAVLMWHLHMKTRLCLLFPSDFPEEMLANMWWKWLCAHWTQVENQFRKETLSTEYRACHVTSFRKDIEKSTRKSLKIQLQHALSLQADGL